MCEEGGHKKGGISYLATLRCITDDVMKVFIYSHACYQHASIHPSTGSTVDIYVAQKVSRCNIRCKIF